MPNTTITPSQMRSAISCATSFMGSKRKIINDLNVFPIPDGDTGDNMFMTIQAGCAKVSELGSDSTVGEIAQAMSSGALMGARGNSGVILSRIIEGIAKGLKDVECADADDVRRALRCAVTESYNAVPKPVEGTILTVMKDAARAANTLGGTDIEQILDTFCTEAEASVRRTPELLDVLREAGVVDSGGAGLFYISQGFMQGFKQGFNQEYDQSTMQIDNGSAERSDAPDVNVDLFSADSVLKFGYCTEFLLRLQTSKVDLESFDHKEIVDYLNSVGDSVVAFRDGSIVKVHVHTFTPGDILNTCQKWGEFLKIKIENMTLQHHSAQVKDNFTRSKSLLGVVVVANGDGIEQMLREAGVDAIVSGGQTMNPSAESFIDAFKSVNAKTIFVFPNNSNIIMTARQAASIYKEADVRVIESRDVGACYFALAALDRNSKDVDATEAAVRESIASVSSIVVSKTIRDAHQGDVDVHKDEYVGIQDHTILCCCPTAEQAAAKSLELCGISADIAIVLSGADTDATKAEELENELSRAFPRTEFILRDGGQAIYNYIIVLQ